MADCFIVRQQNYYIELTLIIAVGILGALTFISMWMAPRDGYARSNKFYEEQEAIDGLHEGESHESK